MSFIFSDQCSCVPMAGSIYWQILNKHCSLHTTLLTWSCFLLAFLFLVGLLPYLTFRRDRKALVHHQGNEPRDISESLRARSPICVGSSFPAKMLLVALLAFAHCILPIVVHSLGGESDVWLSHSLMICFNSAAIVKATDP